jgi:hypothetical protein
MKSLYENIGPTKCLWHRRILSLRGGIDLEVKEIKDFENSDKNPFNTKCG